MSASYRKSGSPQQFYKVEIMNGAKIFVSFMQSSDKFIVNCFIDTDLSRQNNWKTFFSNKIIINLIMLKMHTMALHNAKENCIFLMR